MERYYWIKLRVDFFNSNEIDFLLSQKNGAEYVVLYQMLCLQTANSNGTLQTQMGEMIVPYNIEKIVRDTRHFDIDTVTVALELYKKLGLIYTTENNLLQITNFTNLVGSESASKEAVKKRVYRAKTKEIETLKNKAKNSIGDKKGTKCPTEYRDKSIDIRYNNIYNTNALFEKFWEVYPKKVSKQQALKSFIKIKPDEALLQTMIKQIERSKKTKEWQKDGGQFIPYPSTWLNGARWEDEIKEGDVPEWFDEDLEKEKLSEAELLELKKVFKGE